MFDANWLDLCLNVLYCLQMCWKSYKSAATSADCIWRNQYCWALGFLNSYQFWQSAAVLGNLVKNDSFFCNQARIQVGSWAQSSTVGGLVALYLHPRHCMTYLPHPSQWCSLETVATTWGTSLPIPLGCWTFYLLWSLAGLWEPSNFQLEGELQREDEHFTTQLDFLI